MLAVLQLVNVIPKFAAAAAQLTVPVIVNVADAWLTTTAAVVDAATTLPVSDKAVPTTCEMQFPVEVFVQTVAVSLVTVTAPVPEVTMPLPLLVQLIAAVEQEQVKVSLPAET